MKIYHGSDTLKKGMIPDPFFESDSSWNGSFFALSNDLAKEFGKLVHEFEIDESSIFDLRIPTHQKMLFKKNKDYESFLENCHLGLPIAFSHNSNDELLHEIKNKVKSLGFAGWLLNELEWENQPISVEIWDISVIKKV